MEESPRIVAASGPTQTLPVGGRLGLVGGVARAPRQWLRGRLDPESSLLPQRPWAASAAPLFTGTRPRPTSGAIEWHLGAGRVASDLHCPRGARTSNRPRV